MVKKKSVPKKMKEAVVNVIKKSRKTTPTDILFALVKSKCGSRGILDSNGEKAVADAIRCLSADGLVKITSSNGDDIQAEVK